MPGEEEVFVQGQGGGAGNPNPGQPGDAGGAMIPKHRFDEVNTLYHTAQAEIEKYKKDAESYKEKDARIAQLEKEIADMKQSYELEKSNAKKQSAVEAAIKDKVVDFEVACKLIDFEKITVKDDGTLQGLDEQVKALQKSKPYLWKKPEAKVLPGQKGNTEKGFGAKLAEKKNAKLGVTSKAKTYF